MESNIFWYKIYGNTLCSQIEYPQLLPTNEKRADIFVELAPLKRKIDDNSGCFVDEITKDHIYFCNQVGTFQITNGKRIEICPNEGISLDKLTPFVFGYSIAMLFWQRGQIAVHCSAVEYEKKALIVAGYSGSGKSTLSASLLENGCKLMTDDVAILDCTSNNEIIVLPAFPQQKLCRDMLHRNHMSTDDLLYIDEDKDKFAITRQDLFCEAETKLTGIIFLDVHDGDSLHYREMSGTEKLTVFLENLFLFPMFRSTNIFSPDEMEKCLHIAKNVPMYRMERPKDQDSTSAQVQLIMSSIFHVKEEP